MLSLELNQRFLFGLLISVAAVLPENDAKSYLFYHSSRISEILSLYKKSFPEHNVEVAWFDQLT